MADYTYDEAQGASASDRRASFVHWAGAAMSLGVLAGIGVWGYGVLARDVSDVPVVMAAEGPMREAPVDPGGRLASNQGLAVNAVAGSGAAAAPADRLVLAPRAAGLAAEDVALGDLATAKPPQPTPAALAENAKILELDPGPALAEDDPVQALANLLSNGATPLTPLTPGEDKAVVTDITDVAATLDPKPGPGLASSLRPKMRPAGLKVASLKTVVPAAQSTREIDASTLPVGTRLVQIGAFDSTDAARAEWTRLEGRFGDYLVDKNRVIQRATSGGRTFFRLRAHGFADLSDARRFCAAFVAQNVDCIPVVIRKQ